MKHIEKVNGYGWFIAIIVNVVVTTLAASGLYWVLHEDVAILKLNVAMQGEDIKKIKTQIENNVVMKDDMLETWKRAEEIHARMWDAIRRDGGR